MIRLLLLALAFVLVVPFANAQNIAASHRAVDALAALWRPIAAEQAGSAEAVAAACAGAVEESAAIEAALPASLTPEALGRVRSLGGFLVVPVDGAPGGVYFIPPPEMMWFASGFGAVFAVSEADGFLAARDAASRDVALQLGRAGGRPILRIRDPGGAILTFVGCLSMAGG